MEKKELKIDLGEITISLNVVKNMDSLIEDVTDPDKVPCWAEVWPAARGLARYLWGRSDLEGKKVLELGCGMGLPGIVAGIKGALVTFSDFNPLALEFAAENATKNGLRDSSTLLEDWRTFSSKEKYNLVLGADIIYEPRLIPYLYRVIPACTTPHGEMLFSHPFRQKSLDMIDTLIARENLGEDKHILVVDTEDTLIPSCRICIHSLKRL